MAGPVLVTGSHRLVVARYNEDLGWLHRVAKHWHVTVVKKDTAWDAHRPNSGREASSYLWAMEQYYDDRGVIAFVQGNPFDHCPGLLSFLALDTIPYEFLPLGAGYLVCDWEGGPHHPGLPLERWHEDLVGPIPTAGRWPRREKLALQFVPGAQFCVPAEVIRRKTKEEIRALRERVETEPEAPWVMERLWGPWLTPNAS